MNAQTRWTNSGGLARRLPLLVALCALAMGGKETCVPLDNAREIRRAKENTLVIDIRDLPIQDYPFLAKFKSLKRVRLYSPKGTGGSDEKLKALADINFTNLFDITLLNCPLVTDDGMRALARIRSVKELQLEGTSITDEGCRIMATQMNLDGVNVANCTNITFKGLQQLAASGSMTGLGFSADKLTTEQTLSLISSFKKINECEIVDPNGHLNAMAMTNACLARGIQILVRPDGALQNMQQTP